MRSLIAVLCVALAGCSSVDGRYTVLSTKEVEVSRVDVKKAPLRRDVQGASDGRLWFLFIPLGRAPSVEVATDRALAAGQGDLILSAKVHRTWWSALIVSWQSTWVTGDVLDTTGKGTRDVRRDSVGG